MRVLTSRLLLLALITAAGSLTCHLFGQSPARLGGPALQPTERIGIVTLEPAFAEPANPLPKLVLTQAPNPILELPRPTLVPKGISQLPPLAPVLVQEQPDPKKKKDGLPFQPPTPKPLQDRDPAQTPITLIEFNDLSLVEAMKLLSKESGVNIVVSAEAATEKDGGKERKVNIRLQGRTTEQILREVTRAYGLIDTRDTDSGVYRIRTTKENQRDLTGFREDQLRVYTLLYPNAINVAKAIQELLGNRVQVSFGFTESLIFSDLTQRFTRFDLLNSRSLGLGIQQTGGFGGGGIGGFGGGGIGGFGGGGFGGGLGGGMGGGGYGGLGGGMGGGMGGGGFGGFGVPFGGGIINQQLQNQRAVNQETKAEERTRGLSPEELQQIEDIIANSKDDLERKLRLSTFFAYGQQNINTFVTVIKTNNQLVVRSSDPNVITQIDDLVCKLDIPTPAVLLEVKVLSIDLQDDFTSTFDMQFTDGALVAGSFTTGNILPPFADALNPDARRFATIAPGPLGTAPARQAMFQIVSANFRARLQMLEDKKRVTQLATPLLMTANNEVSQIFTGAQIPVTVGFNPAITNVATIGATTTLGTPITVLQNIGTTLLITPNINADRTVTLRIQQENSNVKKNGATIPVVSGDGGTINQVPVDTVERNTLTGTFIAKDGLTMAVAGLIQEGVADVRQEVPILGRVPYLGVFFRSQLTTRKRTETVVLIRPYVLSTAVESAAVTRAVLHNTSIHPNVQADNLSGLGTFMPREVAVPNPPVTHLQQLFRVHMVQPKDY